MTSIRTIDNSIAWQEHVRNSTHCQKQRARCDAAILRLLQDRMDITRAENEAALDRGAAEHRAWYNTTGE
jgi:hypothetical protein